MNKIIITISRQFGSGGREIGKQTAQMLGIPFYDKELISLASEESGIHKDHFEESEELVNGSLLYSIAMGMSPFGHKGGTMADIPLHDRMFLAQSNVIREVAAQGSCVIVGRCADYILRDKQPCFNVFVHADIDSKIQRISSRLNLDAGDARSTIVKTNRRRRHYYNFYANDEWGKCEHYHLCLDSGVLGVELSAKLICQAVENVTIPKP